MRCFGRVNIIFVHFQSSNLNIQIIRNYKNNLDILKCYPFFGESSFLFRKALFFSEKVLFYSEKASFYSEKARFYSQNARFYSQNASFYSAKARFIHKMLCFISQKKCFMQKKYSFVRIIIIYSDYLQICFCNYIFQYILAYTFESFNIFINNLYY